LKINQFKTNEATTQIVQPIQSRTTEKPVQAKI